VDGIQAKVLLRRQTKSLVGKLARLTNGPFDEEGARNFLDQVFKIWIQPEIERRRTSDLEQPVAIDRCLIKLPRDRPAIIAFNNDIHWDATIVVPPHTSIEKGQLVLLHQVQQISGVQPPVLDGKPVPFVYLFRHGLAYHIIFDFVAEETDARKEWKFSRAIAESLQQVLIERTLRVQEALKGLLRAHGLWAAPALLPYPLSRIAKQLEEGDIERAHLTLREHCTPQFLEEIASKWWSIGQFAARRQLIEDALRAHKEGKYRLSIPALLPQLEGIVTDWIFTQLPEDDVPWRTESKTKRLRDLVLERPPTVFTYKTIVNSAVDFIVDGPVLRTFRRWLDQIEGAFPNRHVVEHGRYDDSIKLFLLLDTVYYILSNKAANTGPAGS
jgi:hypothetical protein